MLATLGLCPPATPNVLQPGIDTKSSPIANHAMDMPSLVGMVQGTIRQLAGFCGLDLYRYADDRRVLEKTILPYFAQRNDFARVLFVGCAWYTRRYEDIFVRQEYWTLDYDESCRKYGSKRHVVDSVENLARHFGDDSLDLLVCNGVFGFGLNAEAAVDRAFQACYACLRPGAIFVLGWNDIWTRRPFRPENHPSLSRFESFVLPPLATASYLTRNSNRHTYNFYVKPGAAAPLKAAG